VDEKQFEQLMKRLEELAREWVRPAQPGLMQPIRIIPPQMPTYPVSPYPYPYYPWWQRDYVVTCSNTATTPPAPGQGQTY